MMVCSSTSNRLSRFFLTKKGLPQTETTLFMLVPVRMCVVYMPFTSAPGLGLLARPPLPRRRAEQDRTLRRLFAGILRISPSTHTHTGHTLQIAYKSCIISSWRRLKSCCVGARITYVGYGEAATSPWLPCQSCCSLD